MLILWDQTTRQLSSLSGPILHVFHVFAAAHLLFSNAEVFEDDIQDLLYPDTSSDSAQVGETQTDTLGCQSQVDVAVPLVLSQGRQTLLQVGPVAGLGQGGGTRQRVATPREEVREQNELEQSTVIIFDFNLNFWLGKGEKQAQKKRKHKGANQILKIISSTNIQPFCFIY